MPGPTKGIFTFMISFTPRGNLVKDVLLSAFYRGGNWDLEGLSDKAKAKWDVNTQCRSEVVDQAEPTSLAGTLMLFMSFFSWPHALLRLFGLELLMDLAKFLSSLGSGIFFVCVEESQLLEWSGSGDGCNGGGDGVGRRKETLALEDLLSGSRKRTSGSSSSVG